MAAVTPVSANRCIGSDLAGEEVRHFYCYKGDDDEGDPIYTCSTMRYFRVSCSKINRQCNALSGAYVAAVTVCNQRLF